MSSFRRGSRNAGSAACTTSASARHVAESQDSSTGLRAFERSRGREAYASVGRPGVRGPRRPDPPRRPRTARRRQRDDQRARRALRHVADRKKHIRLLEEAEVVTTEKVGRVRRCMLTPYAFEGISTSVRRIPSALRRCGPGRRHHSRRERAPRDPRDDRRRTTGQPGHASRHHQRSHAHDRHRRRCRAASLMPTCTTDTRRPGPTPAQSN